MTNGRPGLLKAMLFCSEYTARRLGAQTPPPLPIDIDVIGILTGDGTVLAWRFVPDDEEDDAPEKVAE